MSSLFVTTIAQEERIQSLLRAASMLVKIIKMMVIVLGDSSMTQLRVVISEQGSPIYIA